MPRRPWTRPQIDTRAASDLALALGLLDWLELALVGLRLRWAVIRDDLPNTTPAGQRDWKDGSLCKGQGTIRHQQKHEATARGAAGRAEAPWRI